MNPSVLFSASEVGKLFSISPTTIRNWSEAGRLPAVNAGTASTGQGRGLRFRAESVRQLLDRERESKCGRRLPQIVSDHDVLARVAGAAR
jgi:predicted site-specific integrase-resolvase